jgi:hypothetical protein
VSAHVFQQKLETFFTLTAANNLTDSGNEQVHRGHRFVIIVQPHIKRFDLFREIENGYWAFEMFFGQPAFVLGLQIQSVLDRELEFFAALL